MAHGVLCDGLVEERILWINADMLNNLFSLNNTWVLTQDQYEHWFVALP